MESPFTWLANHVFDPIAAAIARAKTSSNPVVSGLATDAGEAYSQLAAQTKTTLSAPLTGASAVALGNDAVADFEFALQQAVDTFVTATVGKVPVVGQALAPEVVTLANMGLTFAEDHGITFLTSLFSHAKTVVGAAAIPAAPKAATTVSQQ